MEQVILVDENDVALGFMEKIEAHRKAILHRAFSVFLFNSKGQMLLQQRSLTKYHCPGRWTNSCCSHPRPNEPTNDAVARRLMEEMGIEANVMKAFTFIYNARVSKELTEHELDHVFIGKYDGQIKVNSDEVASFAFQSLEEIELDLQDYPEKYTIWFKIAFPRVVQWTNSNKLN